VTGRPSLALIAVPILIGAGCATIPQPLRTYPGPERPAQAVALIAGDARQASGDPRRLDTGGVYVPCLDGVSLERRFGAYDNGARWPHELAVLPGRHDLAVVYDFPRGKRASWASVALDAEAGHRYRVRKELTGDVVRMWVEDAASGATVAPATPMVSRSSRGAVTPCP
jgi:hypothetical protein